MFPSDSFLQLLPCAAFLFPSNAWHLPSLAVIVTYINTQTYRYNLLGLSRVCDFRADYLESDNQSRGCSLREDYLSTIFELIEFVRVECGAEV